MSRYNISPALITTGQVWMNQKTHQLLSTPLRYQYQGGRTWRRTPEMQPSRVESFVSSEHLPNHDAIKIIPKTRNERMGHGAKKTREYTSCTV